ncbi:GNAT family N-acetyltransferase [Pseudonocardia sp. RS11V-5]|uniref:GNAT family N-acetyltransferase n=1 Tax=Pseudonocardia terrae TaxID=2905831 RepID=UPI001E295221|nr:GNAT family N-acetyltransferase [Pseudonocardia terrae]MCE3553277.1 GNAT family N-acetyltransferase [Pseudonocardia terrae]
MTVTLRALDEPTLVALLDAAVAGAEPAEVMPPVSGAAGWSDAARAAFLTFHRRRSVGAVAPVERTWAILESDGRGETVVGAGRLEPVADGLEVGIWLARGARGRGVGRAAVRELVALAGGRPVVAATTDDNAAAVAVLRGLGAVLVESEGAVHAVLPGGRVPEGAAPTRG